MNKLLIFAIFASLCQQIFCTIERKSAADFPLNITRYIHEGHSSNSNTLHRKNVIEENTSHSGHLEPSPQQFNQSPKDAQQHSNSFGDNHNPSTEQTSTHMNQNSPHNPNHEQLPQPSQPTNLNNPVLNNEKPSLNKNEFLQNVVLGIFISFFGVGITFLIINYLRNTRGGSMRQSKANSRKTEFQKLNATFNDLRDKIDEAQGTKYQFYKFNKSRSLSKQAQREQTFYDGSIKATPIKNSILFELNSNQIQVSDTKPRRSSGIGNLCARCGQEIGIKCSCKDTQQLGSIGIPNQRIRATNNAMINTLFSISAKARSITANASAGQSGYKTTRKPTKIIVSSQNNQSFTNNLDNTNLSMYNGKKQHKLSGNINEHSGYISSSPYDFNANFHSKKSLNDNVLSSQVGQVQETQNSIIRQNNNNMNDYSYSKAWEKEQRFLGAADEEEVQKAYAKAELIHSLHVDDILDLYSAKCIENNMDYIPEQATTFILRIKKNCLKRCLKLGELQFGSRSAALLASVLKENDHFARLYLEKNQIGDEGACALAEMLSFNRSLIHLDVGSNGIGPEGFELLFVGLLHNFTLVSLDISSKDGLSRNRLGLKGAVRLGELLRLNPAIQFLRLAATQINLEQIKLIMNGVSEGRTLTMLDLSYNSLESTSAEFIVNGIQNTSLVDLILSHNCLGNAGIALFQDIGVHSKFYSIETLDLSGNDITSKGLAGFFDTMHKNQTLRKLILDDNDFQGTQINRISEFLFENTGLIHLSMERCQIQPEGAVCIAVGMEKNKTLLNLYLKDNSIRDKGAKAFAEALSHKSFLQCLDLSLCKIQDEGGMALAGSAVKAIYLNTLILRENSFHSCVGAVLCNSLEKNTNIRKVDVGRNPINYSYLEKMQIQIKINIQLSEQRKIPLYNDILASMKGKSKDNEDLDDQLRLKYNQQNMFVSQIEVLKEHLQDLLNEEEQKMISIESIKKEVQEEYDQMEASIQQQRKFQDNEANKHKQEREGLEEQTEKLNQEVVKMKANIGQKKINLKKQKEELVVKRLNMQSKLREADTAAKQSLAQLEKLEAQKAEILARIEEKMKANEETEKSDSDNENSSPVTKQSGTAEKKTKDTKKKKK